MQVITFPTLEDYILDTLFTNKPGLKKRCTPLAGISDDDTIAFIEVSVKAKYKQLTKRKIYMWTYIIYSVPLVSMETAK